MDWKRVLRIAGIVVFVIGVVLGGIQLWYEVTTYINGVFLTVVTDMPTEPMPLDCPAALVVGEPGTVIATVPNRTSQVMGYTVSLDVQGSESGLVSPADCSQHLTLSPGEHADVECTLRFNRVPEALAHGEAGKAYVLVWAFSAEDAAKPGPFHMWDSSYKGWCVIKITEAPSFAMWLLTQHVPVALILLAGYGLWVWGCWPLKRRHLFFLILGGLLVLASLIWILAGLL